MTLGICVVVRDTVTLDDVGVCHAPPPVQVGDLVALEHGPPLRVTNVLPVPAGATAVPVLARPAAFVIAAS